MRRLGRAVAPFLVAAFAAGALAGDTTAAAIRAARDAVYSRPEFHYEAERQKSFLEEWWDGYAEWLTEFRETHPVLFTAILVGLALIVAALVVHIVWTVRMARGAQWDAAAQDDIAAAIRRVDPAPLRSRAVEHASAGRFDEAVRDLYTALLFTLDRRGALRYARHKALLDYRMETAQDAIAARTLDLFAGTYHPGSFGRRPPDRAHFDELLRALDALAEPAR